MTLQATHPGDQEIKLFFNSDLIIVIRVVFRITIGYLTQNLAFLVNIYRWLVILQKDRKGLF
jgi:hypothetical protein